MIAIAEEIRKTAIVSPDGSATWVSLAYFAEAQRWQLQPMMARLYDGVTGTALFLAAVDTISPDGGYRELALSAFKTAAHYLEEPASIRALFEAGIGAGLGAADHLGADRGRSSFRSAWRIGGRAGGAASAARRMRRPRAMAARSSDRLRTASTRKSRGESAGSARVGRSTANC